jgi:hydrogenase expression/formation protein HypC
MCLAVPSKIISITDMMATVDVSGARTDVSIVLIPEKVVVGDYVLVHAGFAIAKIDEEQALDTMQLRHDVLALLEAEDNKELPQTETPVSDKAIS